MSARWSRIGAMRAGWRREAWLERWANDGRMERIGNSTVVKTKICTRRRTTLFSPPAIPTIGESSIAYTAPRTPRATVQCCRPLRKQEKDTEPSQPIVPSPSFISSQALTLRKHQSPPFKSRARQTQIKLELTAIIFLSTITDHQPPATTQAIRRRRPPPHPSQCLQERAEGKASDNVQGTQGANHRFRFPNSLRWW